MAGSIRGNPRRRSRFLAVETLESRVLLSTSGPVGPVLGPPLPPDRPAPVVLSNDALAGTALAPGATTAAGLLGPERLAAGADRFALPAASLDLSPGSPLATALAAVLGGESASAGADDRPVSATDPAGGLLGTRGTGIGADRFLFSFAGPLEAAPATPLHTEDLSAPLQAALLGGPGYDGGPGHAWGDVRTAFAAAPTDGPHLSDKSTFESGDLFDWGHELAETRVALATGFRPTLEWGGLAHAFAELYLTGSVGPAAYQVVPPPDVAAPTADVPAPLAAPNGTETGPPAASAADRGPGAEREGGPADRSARTETTPSRAAVETALLAHTDGGANGLAVKEPGRTASAAPTQLQPGPAALADPVAPLTGAAARDGELAGGAGFFQGGAVPADGHGRVVVPRPADGAGGVPAGNESAELPAAPSPGALDLLNVPVQAAALVEGGLPLDVPVLTRDVNAFFARLAALGEGTGGWQPWARFAPWLVLLSAAAFEFGRRWERRAARTPAPADEVLLGTAAFLPEEDR